MPHGDSLGHDRLGYALKGREDLMPHAVFKGDGLHIQKEDGQGVVQEAQGDLLLA